MKKNKSVKIEIKDQLKKDLYNYAENFCVGAAVAVREQLTNTAYEAFERFYCDYTPDKGKIDTTYKWRFCKPDGVPIRYERTYNILENGIKKFYENKHGKIVRGGVRIDPNAMDDVYEVPTNVVFESMYQGYHGVPGRVPRMSPTPEEIIDYIYNLTISNPEYLYADAGVERARKGNYTYLEW